MKVIIIGATSGIGEALAKLYAEKKYEIGITGRREEKLLELQNSLDTTIHIQSMDVTLFDEARQQFLDLIERMGGVDIVIVNSGVGWITTKWKNELGIINTNATGFAAIANAAFYHFSQQPEGGQIVGISSLAAERGGGMIPSYHATKAFMSNYLQGLRYRAIKKKLPISVTDIRPGFVDTPMTEQNDFMFWVSSSEKAARQIASAIQRKKKVAYITKRWRFAAFLMRNLPDFIYAKYA